MEEVIWGEIGPDDRGEIFPNSHYAEGQGSRTISLRRVQIRHDAALLERAAGEAEVVLAE